MLCQLLVTKISIILNNDWMVTRIGIYYQSNFLIYHSSSHNCCQSSDRRTDLYKISDVNIIICWYPVHVHFITILKGISAFSEVIIDIPNIIHCGLGLHTGTYHNGNIIHLITAARSTEFENMLSIAGIVLWVSTHHNWIKSLKPLGWLICSWDLD